MEAYQSFAKVYDTLMDNVPYEQWAAYIIQMLKSYEIDDGLVLDLGCGTGKMTRLLSDAGYDMIGIDQSVEMLEIARDAESAHNCGEILYLNQDMRRFELYGTVRAVISVCDCLNYILNEDEIVHIFSLVNNYLDPGGIFLFDLNTLYTYAKILGSESICENREECSFIWENYFDAQTLINEYDLTIFVKEQDDLYRKYEETHFQRGYETENIIRYLKEAGLEFLGAYDAYTKEPSREESERVSILARKKCDSKKIFRQRKE